MTTANTVPAAQDLLVEQRDGVVWLTLNRPEAVNSVTPGMVSAINAELDQIATDQTVRCIVFTGAGGAFCSGSHLAIVAGENNDQHEKRLDQFIASINSLLNRIAALPLPAIAAINGTALGAGLELALVCDFIVASADARIGDGHARFGLLPGGGASARLPRRIGVAAAKWLSFTGELFPAQELMACGLVQRVYPAAQFTNEVNRLANLIAKRSPLGLRRVKALIENALAAPIEDALANEQRELRLHRSSLDRAEGLAAFAEKREPRFQGM